MVSSSEGGSGAIGYQFMWVGILVVGGGMGCMQVGFWRWCGD